MGLLAKWLGYAWRRWGDYQSIKALWDLLDIKTVLYSLLGLVGMTLFGATEPSWSPPAVLLAAAIVAACVAIVVIAVRIVIRRPKTTDAIDRGGPRLTAPPYKRDVALSEAIAFLCFKKWNMRFIDAAAANNIDAPSVYDEVLQSAADGVIPMWGKQSNHGVFEPIPREYWFSHRFDWFSLLRGDAFSESSLHTFSGDKYVSLMTSRAATECLQLTADPTRQVSQVERA